MIRNTPEQVAATIFAMTKGKPDLQTVAKGYTDTADLMRRYAEKAKASSTGKYRGYTETHALEIAANSDAYAAQVPASLRSMGAAS